MRRRILLNKNNGGNYEAVDLGLPTGIKWATMNVGAESETDYGKYYKWRDTKEWTNDYISYETGDTATFFMGGNWRMPTHAEWWELVFNTNFTYVSNYNGSGVNGLKVMNKNDASKYIFFPFGGEMRQDSGHEGFNNNGSYWTNDGESANGYVAYLYSWNGGEIEPGSNTFKWYGLQVRGVKDI